MRLAWIALILLSLPAPVAAQACAGSTSYSLSSPLAEVPETANRMLQVTFQRSGDTSCTAEANVRLVGADLDFRGPTNLTMHLAPGQSSTAANFEVRDDPFPEAQETFTAIGDLRETVSGRVLDYPGFLRAHFAIQANDGYTPSTHPVLYFLEYGNRTVTAEGEPWTPRLAMTFPPALTTTIRIVLANGTCPDCRIGAADVTFVAGSSFPAPAEGNDTLRAWTPDDNRTEAPQAACLRIAAPPSIQAGPPRPWVILDDDNRTFSLWNRSVLHAQGVANATVAAVFDPCGAAQLIGTPAAPSKAVAVGKTGTSKAAPPRITTVTAPAAAAQGIPKDSPLLVPHKSPAVAWAGVVLVLGAAGARRRALR